MSATTLLRSVGGLTFDSTIKESHEDTSTVTDSPVETGVAISDHMYRNPIKLSIMAAVSDVPLGDRRVDSFASDVSRSIKAYEMLVALKNAAEPFDVQTGLKLYTSMVCTSITVSQDKDTSRILEFTAELREVIIVKTQEVKYPPRKSGATKRQGDQKKDKGEQQGAEQTSQKKQSLASKLLGGLTK